MLAGDQVQDIGLASTAGSGFPDPIRGEPEVGSPHLLEQRQEGAADQFCGALEAAGGGTARAPRVAFPCFATRLAELAVPRRGFAAMTFRSDHSMACPVAQNGTKTVVGLLLSDLWTT